MVTARFHLNIIGVLVLLFGPIGSASDIALYRFSEGSGTTTTDASGNGHTGTLNGAVVFSADVPSGGGPYSASFDGSGTSVRVPHAADLLPTGTFVVEADVKITSYPASSSHAGIVGKGGWNSGDGFELLASYNGTVTFNAYIGGTTYPKNLVSISKTLATGAWHSIRASYDGTTVTLAFDGSTVAQTTTTLGGQAIAGSLAQNTNMLFIGERDTANSYRAFYNGLLDNVRITSSTAPPPPNNPPTATAQNTSTIENTPLAITIAGTDPEGSTLTYAITTQPAHGTITGFNTSAGSLTYTPSAGFVGADSFAFTANDGTSSSLPAQVSIQVDFSGDDGEVIRTDSFSIDLSDAAFAKILTVIDKASFDAIDASFSGELTVTREFVQPPTGRAFARWLAGGSAGVELATSEPIMIPTLSVSLPGLIGKYAKAGVFIHPTLQVSLTADALVYNPMGDSGGNLVLAANGALEFGALASLKTSPNDDALLSLEVSGSATVEIAAEGGIEFSTKRADLIGSAGLPGVTMEVEATASILGLGITATKNWKVWRGYTKNFKINLSKTIAEQ